MVFNPSMNTISSLQINTTPAVTPFKGIKVGLPSIKSAVEKGTKFPTELNGLRQKYFNEYSSMDKFLIKLHLKHDNSKEMAVLASVGAKPMRNQSGTISVERFGTYEQAIIRGMGLDENKVFKQITGVRKNAEFDKNANITSLENLEDVRGNLYLCNSKIQDLGKLTSVGRHVYLNGILNKNDFDNVNVAGCILK